MEFCIRVVVYANSQRVERVEEEVDTEDVVLILALVVVALEADTLRDSTAIEVVIGVVSEVEETIAEIVAGDDSVMIRVTVTETNRIAEIQDLVIAAVLSNNLRIEADQEKEISFQMERNLALHLLHHQEDDNFRVKPKIGVKPKKMKVIAILPMITRVGDAHQEVGPRLVQDRSLNEMSCRCNCRD